MLRWQWILVALAISCAPGANGTPGASATKLADFGSGQAGPFVFPLSWQQATWFIDPQNASGCASDNNRTCSSASCSSSGTSTEGPCLTYGSLAGRWGTYFPRLRQTVTITALSSVAGNADPLYVSPFLENGSSLIVTGVLGPAQQTATGVLGAVVVKNRATPQLLTAVLPAGAGLHQLVFNATHPSYAWTYALVSGTNFKMTQPVQSVTPPFEGSGADPTEVDTWAPGDTVSVYTPVNVNIARIGATLVDDNAVFTNGVFAGNMVVYDPNGPGWDQLYAGSAVTFYQAQIQRPVGWASEQQSNIRQANVNCENLGGFMGGTTTLSVNWWAGSIDSSVFIANIYNGLFSGDIVIAGAQDALPGFTGITLLGSTTLGFVYIESNDTINIPHFGTNRVTAGNIGPGPIVWGPGSISLYGAATISYPTGAGGATAAFLQKGGFVIDGQTKACIGIPSVSSPTPACNIVGVCFDPRL